MPNLQVLKPVPNEEGVDMEKDASRKFTNIDKEPFEFTWDGIPFGGMFPDRMEKAEEKVSEKVINEKGFPEVVSSNKTVYKFTKPIEPGETVTMPKYLVNYAAMHLARKMYKREAFSAFKGTDEEKKNAAIKFVNPQEEWKLMEKMVAANFPDKVVEEAKMPTEKTVIDKTQVDSEKIQVLKCDKCDFVAKSKIGLMGHGRKHK